MNNMDLITRLTWAIVEMGTNKPDAARVVEALEGALEQALLNQEKQNRMRATIVRTAAVCDAPVVTDAKIHEGGAL